jgi:hypothetical protein
MTSRTEQLPAGTLLEAVSTRAELSAAFRAPPCCS